MWNDYVLKQEKLLDEKLQLALSQKIKQNSRLKYYATAIGVFIGSGMFQKTLGYLFGEKTFNHSELKTVKDTLLVEQAVSDHEVLPTIHDTLDLSSENSVDYSLIPELSEQKSVIASDFGGDQSSLPAEEVFAPVNEKTVEMLKTSFINNHPLIDKVGGAVDIVNGKVQVVFDIGVGGDFELKQQALRRIMMDVFPVQEILDKDGLSALDIGRIESNVTTFSKLLEGKSFHGFRPDIIKDVMYFDGKQLVITDYEKLSKLSEKIFEDSKNWVPDMKSGFVRVGQNTADHIWESMVKQKMINIKF